MPAFLIAAGGTAGHVLPALAVAEALRDRGARVTFAGSPDRAEARLVPDAGFELDTFRVSGLPRAAGLAQARAALHALAAPAACERILARRRPDVVLGGGGYVSGPMVLAAARRDPGRADGSRRPPRPGQPSRGAVRAARLPLVPDSGPGAAEVPRHRPADPGTLAARPAGRGPAAVRAARRTGRCCSSPEEAWARGR